MKTSGPAPSAISGMVDHETALARIDELMDAETGTREGMELDVLVDLVELYESKHVPMSYPSPLAAIEFRMEQGGLIQRDLVPFIGSRAKVSEVLSGKCHGASPRVGRARFP